MTNFYIPRKNGKLWLRILFDRIYGVKANMLLEKTNFYIPWKNVKLWLRVLFDRIYGVKTNMLLEKAWPHRK